jgi:hypothetical protein
MICEDVRLALAEGELCEESESGARVVTHCLYPSFEPVEVFVTKFGEGYIVTDGGGAVNSAWLHGRDEIRKLVERESARYGVSANDGAIQARVPSIEWLRSAIIGVANASASAASAALERAAVAAERVLSDKIYDALVHVVPKSSIAREHEHRGASGKRWRYDYAATTADKLLLLNAVTPHHVSISAKYVAFADLPANDVGIEKLAVFGRKLETDDVALITQVATLVPVTSLEQGVRRLLTRS